MSRRARYILAFLAVVVVLVGAGAWKARAATHAGEEDGHTLGVQITPTGDGLRVDAVVPGGVADGVGIRAGDLLVGVDRRPVATVAELEQRVGAERGSDDLTLQVTRDGMTTEAWVASSPYRRQRNASEPVADRNCATLALDAARGVYRETGCAVSRSKICNGCLGS